MKYPKVKVTLQDPNYEVKVAVYRHVTTPNEIYVRIEQIRPLPPKPLVAPEDDVVKVVTCNGKETVFSVDETYPP